VQLLGRIFGKDDRIRGYAAAFVAIAQAEGALDRVEEELYAFAKAVERQPPLQTAMADRSLPVENRQTLVRDVIGDRAHPVTVNLVSFLIEADRGRDLSKVAEGVAAIAAELREHEVAEIRSAVPLSDTQVRRLEEALSRATGHTVEAKVVVDPTLVGGVIARVGDEIFDGSIASRLNEAKQALGG
jgi:F-type H+-transporting ATPase subunit delta